MYKVYFFHLKSIYLCQWQSYEFTFYNYVHFISTRFTVTSRAVTDGKNKWTTKWHPLILNLLFPLLVSLAMTRKLGKMIISMYLLLFITYAAPVWGYLAAMHKKKLQSIVNKSLQLAAKVHHQFPSCLLRSGLGIHSLADTIRYLAHKLYACVVRYSDNSLITRLGQYCIWCPGNLWKWARCVLR